MHPLINDMTTLKDSELESRIYDLTKKYFMTTNVNMRSQISMVLESYTSEQAKRQKELWQTTMENKNKGLDKLINVG
jgi:hypothetical protein